MIKNYLLTIIFGLVSIFLTFNKIIANDLTSSIIVSLILIALALSFDFLKNHITEVKKSIMYLHDRVNIHCTMKPIADSLESILHTINQHGERSPVAKYVGKRLNGLSKKIGKKSIPSSTLTDILTELQACTLKHSFFATSTAPIEWWFEPEWITYLSRQLIICSQKPKEFAKRYFIYPREALVLYREELGLFDSVHQQGNTTQLLFVKEKLQLYASQLLNQMANEVSGDIKVKILNAINQNRIPDMMVVCNNSRQLKPYYRDTITEETLPAKNHEIPEYEVWIKFLEKAELNGEINISLQDLMQQTIFD